ncbi:MAG TPA: TrbC/VirB2 family protein [Noviherbaspirillum sp.]|nr:TrbC/VirB2 family protein [Noviherbaspirillum sp.]
MNNQYQSSKQTAVSVGKAALIVGVSLLMVSTGAFAQTADPMGDGICKLVNLLTGKWLFGFTILATLGAGSALLFGAEISDGLKKLATIITIVGIILAMSSLLAMAFAKFGGVSC